MKQLMLLILIPFFWVVPVSAAVPAVVIQSEAVTIHVKADGSVERNVSLTMKLNTFQALRTVGEWFYSYNPKLEEIEILKSVTIHKNGSRFSAPKNAILDQTPSSVENAPDFSNIREKMVSFIGLEPGCTIEFQYKTKDLAPHRAGVLEPMGGPWPILIKTVTVQLNRKAKVHINGNIGRTADGVYKVENASSLRPAHGFSNSLDLPFLYIEIDNPVSRVKELMRQGKTLEPVVLEALEVTANSTSLEVETALNHLLNQRMATVQLDPALTGWKGRDFSEVVQSGYATPLEKVLLAHFVLDAYHIPHTAAIRADKIDGIPIAASSEFQLNGDLCQILPAHEWKPAFLLLGESALKQPDTTVLINAELKENEDGTLTGTVTARKNSVNAQFSLSSLNPMKDANVSDETVLLKTGNALVKSGKLTLTLKDKQIQINPVLADMFHLSNLEQAVLAATSIRMPELSTGAVHLQIDFLKKPSLALPENLKAANSLGSAETAWELQGNRLTMEQKFQVSPFKVETKDFDKVNALLIPALTGSASIAFIQ